MIGMFFHINSVLIGIEMSIDFGVFTSSVSQDKPGNHRAGNFIEKSSGCVAKEMGVQMLIDL